MAYIIIPILSYLLGCSNMAFYLAKRKGVDLATRGSGNAGASNAAIVLGWRAGILVAIHDIGKAFLAALIARALYPDITGIAAVAGAACVLGHIFPLFFSFKGGKGFAPFIGMMLALNWKFALAVLLAVVIVTLVFDYLVIGTTLAVVSLPVYMLLTCAGWLPVLAVCAVGTVILCKHRQNYLRICRGTEIGLRSTLKGEHRVK